MLKIAGLVNNLGPSQLAYHAIHNINYTLINKPELDILLFYENVNRPCLPLNFAVMQMYEAWNYDGICVATDLNTAAKLINFPGPKRKFFYVWDLEWLRLKQKHFNVLYNIYAAPQLELLARSKSHAKLIEDCWNTKVTSIIDNFNLREIMELCQY